MKVQAITRFVGCLLCLTGMWAVSHAQFANVINLPPDLVSSPIASDTQVNVLPTGSLGSNFRGFQIGESDGSSTNIEINVLGGAIGDVLYVHAGATMNVYDGVIGEMLQAFSGSTINVLGGRIQRRFTAEEGSNVIIAGGKIDPIFRAKSGSRVQISGGDIDGRFSSDAGSVVEMSGGTIEGGAILDGVVTMTGGSIGGASEVVGQLNLSGGYLGAGFDAFNGSSLNLFGGEMRLDGVPVSGLESVGNSVPLDIPNGSVLNGTLADGSPFLFSLADDLAAATLTLHAADVPAIGPAIITASTDTVPAGIRSGQTLVVDEGALVSNFRDAGWGSRVEVQSGGEITAFEGINSVIDVVGGTTGALDVYLGSTVQISGDSEVHIVSAFSGSNVEVLGGSTTSVHALNEGTLNMTDGTLTWGFSAHSGSTVNIHGGAVGGGGSTDNTIDARENSVVNVSGGRIGRGFDAQPYSLVRITGGSFGDGFNARQRSDVTLVGGSFLLDGIAIDGLAAVGDSIQLDIPFGSRFSGILEDGTPFVFSSSEFDRFEDGTLTVVVAEVAAPMSTLINLPTDEVPNGLRNGQTLIVDDGGDVPDNFNSDVGSAMTVMSGATVGYGFEALGSSVRITGGTIGDAFDAFSGAIVSISGGTIGDGFSAHQGSAIEISGGLLGPNFRAFEGSTVNLIGDEFLLNGEPISGMELSQPFTLTDRSGRLSGRFADGSPFEITLGGPGRPGFIELISSDALLTLTLVPEPHSIALFVLAAVCGLPFCGRRTSGRD